MEYQKLLIVFCVIVFLLLTLLVIKVLQKKNLLITNSGKLKLNSNITLTKDTSAHVIQYYDEVFLVLVSKNGGASVTALMSNDPPLDREP